MIGWLDLPFFVKATLGWTPAYAVEDRYASVSSSYCTPLMADALVRPGMKQHAMMKWKI